MISAAAWVDLLMAWYEGHTVPSQALRDEIERALSAHARQQVEALRERAAQAANESCKGLSTCGHMCHDNTAAAIRAMKGTP